MAKGHDPQDTIQQRKRIPSQRSIPMSLVSEIVSNAKMGKFSGIKPRRHQSPWMFVLDRILFIMTALVS